MKRPSVVTAMLGWRGFDPHWCRMTYGRYSRTTSFAPNAREISDGIANLRRFPLPYRAYACVWLDKASYLAGSLELEFWFDAEVDYLGQRVDG